MKNIHIIPTDKPSRLVLRNADNKLVRHTPITKWHSVNQHIYITSDEEIKEGDWIFNEEREPSVLQCIGHGSLRGWNKIILTTDQDLIKDGVQAIDDEFLEWFVKNPSCEEVSVERYGYMPDEPYEYKIIIPKKESIHCDCGFSFDVCSKRTCPNEEPKQERMYSEEEVLDILFTMSVDNPNDITKWFEQFKNKQTKL